MSFFGFDTALPRDRGHNTGAPGFSQAADPFAGLSRQEDDDDALNFEDTYDGLGDKLDETNDAFNDDTFGGGPTAASKPVGKDFDFFGQTAKVADAINEEQARFTRQQPISKVVPRAQGFSQAHQRPARSGYEQYNDPDYVPDMQVDANLWGVAPKRNVPATESLSTPSLVAGGRKMMSLAEVEAAMRAQAKKPPQAQASQPAQYQVTPQQHPQQYHPSPQNYQQYPPHSQNEVQFPVQASGISQHESGTVPTGQPVHISNRSQPPNQHANPSAQALPTQILQNPNRFPTDQHRAFPTGRHSGHSHLSQQQHGHQSRSSESRHIVTHAEQLTSLSEDDRIAFLVEEAKRAKRNHKIFLLSRDNGLMTPHDKNFITRIQLQQLVTAIGNPNERGTDSGLSEDFYYQVYNSLRGAPRQHPGQPLSNFAQTYLFQTGGRHGGMRRQARGGDNHMQRMEQQVQRAVEAAKNKPKNKQLVIEGSLGKISFSNAKTPKPLLNIKRTDSGADANRLGSAARDRKAHLAGVSGNDRKTVLADIESVYKILMKMDDHERHAPPSFNENEDINPGLVGLRMDWDEKKQKLNSQLWSHLKVHEPIGATATHPFIAFLSFAKGKKALPRVFRHISQEQRTTILTMIIVHLDQLDVVRQALLLPGETQLNASIRENVDCFSLVVMPSLFALLNEAGLHTVIGVLGIILSINLDMVARTRIGASMLTMILSRAELSAGSVNEQEWQEWVSKYNAFFDALEPTLSTIFPGTVNTGEDVYVWQFLAAIGIGASPEQQQRLVMAVKDRVMETVNLAKTLPLAMSSQRLANVNLFMRSIGLDVELLA
ncbi:topoisomerase II-associated protein PAT1 [Diplocarpon rosae]|nr:topoisomerase II-associated protein PAT1 [Diplocarpon rosae]